MDVNSTKFHLLRGAADWQRCQENPNLIPLPWQDAAWDADRNAVTLQPALTLFRHKQTSPLAVERRRGAARDAYGNQFWIAQNRQEIVWIPAADQKPVLFWTQSVTPPITTPDQFHPTVVTPTMPLTLAGMAVNTAQYLIVGYTGGPVGEKGVLLFDLRAGGPPIRLIFPTVSVFEPFDMAADADGNVWILDRTHRTYWGLDREFRLIGKPVPAATPPEPPEFAPIPPLPAVPPVTHPTPTEGFALEAVAPVSIEAMPDGTVLILDTPPGTAPSRLFRYHLADRIGAPQDLIAALHVATDGTNETADHLDVRGYDLSFQAQTADRRVLYIVEQDGNQVIAFETLLGKAAPPANFGALTLTASDAYLPLLYFGGRALLTHGGDIYYDVTVATGKVDRDASTRWVTLQSIGQPHFAREALLYTPILDGKAQDCVWHRLFLDACLPADTSVEISSRAANSLELLVATMFRPEPRLYLRGCGAEIPYYDPFPGNTDPDRGVYETLFQEAQGQYLQIQLRLIGNGRATPVLSHLRAYYPRFSYPRHYLPALYLENAESLSFLERMLANPEGFYSEIEGKIENVSALFDARSAPPETLDWLASWMGLLVDPLWQTIQQRRADATLTSGTLIMEGGVRQQAPDRRRLLIRFARHLYERRGTLEGLRFALHLLLDPCLETTLDRLKRLAVVPQSGGQAVNTNPPGTSSLVRDLKQYGLPLPTPISSDADLEDLLYLLVAAPNRPSTIRIVERFRTRGGRAAVEGDPTASGGGTVATSATVAHRFTVLIPQGLLPEEEAMVNRLIQLERPAHTLFDVRYYWEGFRVGEARLGIDTLLSSTPTYLPVLLGSTALTAGYLSARPPMDAPDRVISDRDRVGDMPAL